MKSIRLAKHQHIKTQIFDGDTEEPAEFGGGSAANVTFTPSGGIAATSVQAALVELDTEKATPAAITSAISALSSVYQPLDSDLTAVAALTTTSFGRGLLSLANTAALAANHSHGSSGLAHSFAGYNTIGGTWTTMTASRMLCKQVTLAADCLVNSVDAYVRGSTDAVGSAAAVILDDNAGAPGHLLGGSAQAGSYLSNSSSMPTSAEWLSVPVGRYVPAGTYWIGFMGSSSWQIANDGSGTDQYFSPSGGAVVTGGYPSAWAITTGTVKFSIRASILS